MKLMRDDHHHDMRMTFPNNDLNPVYVCVCGVTTTSGEAALALDGKSDREDIKRALFTARYGTSGGSLLELVNEVDKARTHRSGSRWDRLVRWWREDVAQSHHRGCGGQWLEAGTSGFAVLRIHFVCSKCSEETYILHSPGG